MSYNLFPNYPPSTSPKDYRPSSDAFECPSAEGWELAVRICSNKYRHRKAERGAWDLWTIGSLGNWIASLIKLKHFEEAELCCKNVLREMADDSGQMSPAYCSVQCSLATCLFLAGHIGAGERLQTEIKLRPAFYSCPPARDFFEVMCATFETKRDCVVLRDSSDAVENLEPVADYRRCRLIDPATASKMPRLIGGIADEPRASIESSIPSMSRLIAMSSSFGSLRRKISLTRKPSIKYEPPVPTAAEHIHGPSHHQTQEGRRMGRIIEGQPLEVHANSIVNSSNFSRPFLPRSQSAMDMTSNSKSDAKMSNDPGHKATSTATDRGAEGVEPLLEPIMVAKQVNIQQLDFQLPASTKHSVEPHAVAKRRSLSVDTTRSSHLKDFSPKRLLKVAIHGKHEFECTAMLDSGADKNCISKALSERMEATIEPTDVSLIDASGQYLRVLGEVKVQFSWVCNNGATKHEKLPFCVVEDLPVEMLVCAKFMAYLKQRGLSSVLLPILLATRSPKDKQEDLKRTQQAAAAAKKKEADAAAQRKAQRAAIPPGSPGTASSAVGGSETTADSRSSSLTGLSSASSA